MEKQTYIQAVNEGLREHEDEHGNKDEVLRTQEIEHIRQRHQNLHLLQD